jgi:hypothetical protein
MKSNDVIERLFDFIYSVVCLDFFGLLFLLIKLVIIPAVSSIRNRCSRKYQAADLHEIELRDFVQQQVDEAIKEWELKRTRIRYSKDLNASSFDMRERHGENLTDRF